MGDIVQEIEDQEINRFGGCAEEARCSMIGGSCRQGDCDVVENKGSHWGRKGEEQRVEELQTRVTRQVTKPHIEVRLGAQLSR